MDISTLYKFPILTRSAGYDPTLPQQYWRDDAAAALAPDGDYVYQCIRPDGTLHTAVITNRQAATGNVPASLPIGTNASRAVNLPPVDMTKMPAGGVITVNPMGVFGGLPQITFPNTPAPGSDADKLSQILALVQKIAAKVGV